MSPNDRNQTDDANRHKSNGMPSGEYLLQQDSMGGETMATISEVGVEGAHISIDAENCFDVEALR